MTGEGGGGCSGSTWTRLVALFIGGDLSQRPVWPAPWECWAEWRGPGSADGRDQPPWQTTAPAGAAGR